MSGIAGSIIFGCGVLMGVATAASLGLAAIFFLELKPAIRDYRRRPEKIRQAYGQKDFTRRQAWHWLWFSAACGVMSVGWLRGISWLASLGFLLHMGVLIFSNAWIAG